VFDVFQGFVKIARWTDMNYWALKQTTDKTHRTLHKHIKSFQVHCFIDLNYFIPDRCCRY